MTTIKTLGAYSTRSSTEYNRVAPASNLKMVSKRSISRAWVVLGATLAVSAAIRTGPEVGARIPEFSLADQNGMKRDLASIAGVNGAMIVFYRSADW